MAKIQGSTSRIVEKALVDEIPVSRVAKPQETGNFSFFLSSGQLLLVLPAACLDRNL